MFGFCAKIITIWPQAIDCIRVVVPNLGSIDPLVVHRRYPRVHRIINFVLQLIGGGPQNIENCYRGSTTKKGWKPLH